ncbi:SusC/RagA family TonB-linked outer membrane protein [Pedobacter sp. Du54]|uniref:SusC/RagA family TonB-linked outer membrane protein n=1 Tax=Pedobacter anseongensis TaxID=3133439 RepID=UPI0030B4E1CB
MKLTATIILLSLMQVSAATFGQNLTLKEKNISYLKLFFELRKQTGYDVLIKSTEFNSSKRIDANFQDAPVDLVMKEIIYGNNLDYEIEEKTIIIKEKSKSVLERIIDYLSTIDVTGKIVDERGDPIAGATIKVKGTSIITKTDNNGQFIIKNIAEDAMLEISSLGFKTKELIAAKNLGNIKLDISINQLNEVGVVSTGYETVSKERINGSVTTIDNELFNRRVSSDVLSRLNGISSGAYFNNTVNQGTNSTGITVRGQTTFIANSTPLIVVDSFPFEGDINSLNPNDIENISILKDASAASLWGARSGNGVIVITTKKGKLNQGLKIGFNTSYTITEKPDIFYDQQFLNSSDFISIEKVLFDNGYYNNKISNTNEYPGLTPAVDIFQKLKTGKLTSTEGENQLNEFKLNDVRDDFLKYIYRKNQVQQYALNLSGGGTNTTYYVGLGYDDFKENLIKNNSNRLSVTNINTYTPIKGLQFTSSIVFSQSNAVKNNRFSWGNLSGPDNSTIYSYATLVDKSGASSAIVQNHSLSYVDSLSKLGFLDWKLRPIDEINLVNNRIKNNNLRIALSAKYEFNDWLSIDLQYQNQKSTSTNSNLYDQNSFFSRNLINTFTIYNPTSKSFTFQVPKGGILYQGNGNSTANSYRSQLNFAKHFGHHSINGLVGYEVRESVNENFDGRISYGFTEYGTSSNALNYSTFLTQTGGFGGRIPEPNGSILSTTQRYISQMAKIFYSFKDRYSITLSGRRDGANIFGVKANDKVTPLGAVDLGWVSSNEKWYKLTWLPYLKIRGSYGYNGNVYFGSAYLTAAYIGTSINTGLSNGNIITAPNPELQWETIRTTNFGIDFKTNKDVLTGSIDIYKKTGKDLIDNIELAPSTGFTNVLGNISKTSASGIDINLTSNNISGIFNWSTNLLTNLSTSKVLDYSSKNTTGIQITSGYTGSSAIGNSINGLYSFKYAGLDPVNGDPIGFINNLNSKDYTSIISNATVGNGIVYNGSTRPLIFGSIRNMFSFKGFSASVNITYAMKYYFKKRTINLNYQNLLTSSKGIHNDYVYRWQKPGDEAFTNVPSLIYQTNDNRNSFYENSEVNIEKADHIRLQDISLSYNLSNILSKQASFKNVVIYFYANNLGILWKANKSGYDPDAISNGSITALPSPKTYSISLRTNF